MKFGILLKTDFFFWWNWLSRETSADPYPLEHHSSSVREQSTFFFIHSRKINLETNTTQLEFERKFLRKCRRVYKNWNNLKSNVNIRTSCGQIITLSQVANLLHSFKKDIIDVPYLQFAINCLSTFKTINKKFESVFHR